MIELYAGTPGSGKSLHATWTIRDALYWRRYPTPVIANFDLPGLKPVSRQYFHYVPNADLSPQVLIDFADEWWGTHRFKEDGILLVVDEVQLLHNSREWANSNRMSWLEFYSQHRHFGYHVIWVAQSDKMIDRQFRALIEYEVDHRKLSNFGVGGKLMSLLFLGRLHACVRRYYGLSERVAVSWLVARSSLFKLYDSYSTFERGVDS